MRCQPRTASRTAASTAARVPTRRAGTRSTRRRSAFPSRGPHKRRTVIQEFAFGSGFHLGDAMSRNTSPRRSLAVGMVLVSVSALSTGQPAFSVTPGANGVVAYVHAETSSASEIWTMSPDGTGATNRSNDAENDSNPDVSPDGTKIAYIRGDSPDRDVWVMNVDGSDQQNLTNSADDDEQDPAWSP